jgi:hypothetical protein
MHRAEKRVMLVWAERDTLARYGSCENVHRKVRCSIGQQEQGHSDHVLRTLVSRCGEQTISADDPDGVGAEQLAILVWQRETSGLVAGARIVKVEQLETFIEKEPV